MQMYFPGCIEKYKNVAPVPALSSGSHCIKLQCHTLVQLGEELQSAVSCKIQISQSRGRGDYVTNRARAKSRELPGPRNGGRPSSSVDSAVRSRR